MAVLRVCTHPGCRRLVPGARCSEHAYKSKHRQSDSFYRSKAWRTLRGERLRIEPLCRECMRKGIVRAAYAVDHIKRRSDRPDLELDIDNTQSLCQSCHNRKSAREKAADERGASKK